MTRYSLYSHDFQINDTVISVFRYTYIPAGTKVKIAAITPTGALKFYGIKGTYKADNFKPIFFDTPTSKKEETVTKSIQKYIAIRISDANFVSSKEHTYPEDHIDELANQIDLEGEMPPWGTLVASTKEEIQAKINLALRDSPQDIWMIFFGHTVAKAEINVSYKTI